MMLNCKSDEAPFQRSASLKWKMTANPLNTINSSNGPWNPTKQKNVNEPITF